MLFPPPGLEPLATVTVDLAPPLDFGPGPDGHHRTVPITGGTVDGPALSGRVLPGGADWQRVLPDGTVFVEARYTLELSGALVGLVSTGVRTGPPEVLAALARGEDVDPAEYYFRVTLRATTADARYRWLTTSVLIGRAERTANQVRYDLHRLL
ncbi:DUF3237 domain-containing protein [Amycolatopsis dongchuanensis]|uniref:DUF3237 domain-containing protein n=1 Tax=Amycolatopsis dongchuanensis TaxID=1070866 RepID=UPI0031F9B5E7